MNLIVQLKKINRRISVAMSLTAVLVLFQNFTTTGQPGFYVWDSQGRPFTSTTQTVPFSFTYDGTAFNPNVWPTIASTPTSWTYRDPSGVLEVTIRMSTYSSFGAAKWVLEFRNISSNKNTGVIANLNAANIQMIGDSGTTQRYVVNYMAGTIGEHPATDGSQNGVSDFTPIRNAPAKNSSLQLHSSNGRSSSGIMPYFNIEAPGGGAGMIFAIGWSGQWKGSFNVDSSGTSMQFFAGQETLSAQLRPGEKFRTPSILMMPWTGNNVYVGYNKFRKLMLQYFSPHDSKGQLPTAIAAASTGGLPTSWDKLGSSHLLETINSVSKMNLSLNTFWQDAGWYPVITSAQDPALYTALTTGGNQLWVSGVGDWTPDSSRYPRGYGEVSDAAHNYGMKSLLWFEPERMAKPSANYSSWNNGRLFQSIHPDGSVEQKLFGQVNFSDGTNVNQMLDIISTQIKADKIDIFRQDMNGDGPLPFWTLNDSNQELGMGIQRKGLTEAGYIAGLYYFWDALRARHPGLVIDNCAGGGRRADFEALSRTVLLWRSDRVWDTTEQQNQMLGLALYIPLQGRGTDQFNPAAGLSGVDAIKYKIRSGAGWMSSYAFAWNSLDADVITLLQNETGWFFGTKSPFGAKYPLSEIFKGDFYPMSYDQINALGSYSGSMPSYIADEKIWVGWQFYRNDLRMGLVQAFRRSNNADENYNFTLQGLRSSARYVVTDLDVPGQNKFMTGQELMTKGLTMSCSGKACSKLFTIEDTQSRNWTSKINSVINRYLTD